MTGPNAPTATEAREAWDALPRVPKEEDVICKNWLDHVGLTGDPHRKPCDGCGDCAAEEHESKCPRCGSDDITITRTFEAPWHCESCHLEFGKEDTEEGDNGTVH